MGLKINSALAALVILIAYYVQKQSGRDLKARQQGCQPPRKYPSVDPLFGFDALYALHQDMPSICAFHERYGKTFEIRTLLAKSKIMTIATENLQSIHNGIDDWGVEPFRRKGMEYFVGLGFITCDGAIWQHSRKLLRPTFNKSNISDLTSLSTEVNAFLDKLPGAGGSVDLQPLLFLLVSC